MTNNKTAYIALAALAATGTVVEAKAETGTQALAKLRADIEVNSVLREEYFAKPLKVLSRYGVTPDVQIEALAEAHGFTQIAGCVCTGCCVTNVNT